MATQLWLGEVLNNPQSTGWHFGTNNTTILGSAISWRTNPLIPVRGSNVVTSLFTPTVAGPTNGVDLLQATGVGHEWLSLPLAADVTISGTITFNIWAAEDNMSANAAINALIERISPTGAIVSTIIKTARVTELGFSGAAVNNFTGTPTSTAMTKGDRIRVRLFGDDAGTMGTGFTFYASFAGPTAGVGGDTYITFNENLTFISADPTGTTLHLTDVAGPAVGANVEKEMWTSFGDGVNTAVRNTAAGWTAPLQWTDTAGGTAIEWYSKPLTAFTLSGPVLVNLWAEESNAAATAGVRAELAVCANDGSGATIWAAIDLIDMSPIGTYGTGTTQDGELIVTTSSQIRGYLIAPDVAVADGQRLRMRVFIDDAGAPMATGHTATLRYDHTTTGSGDSFITLGQSVTEFVDFIEQIIVVAPSQAVHRAASW